MKRWRLTQEPPYWPVVGLTIVAAAAVLRFYHLDHGLPASPDVDASRWVDEAARMVKLDDWRPTNFQYPTFFTYLLAGLYRLLPAGSVYAQHLIARGVSATFGVGMAALAWVLGRKIGGGLAAAVGTCLVSFSVVSVTSSRMAATDTMTACLVTAALCFLVRAPVRMRDMLAAGALIGLAAGTKFSGGLALVTVWIAGAHAGWVTGRWGRAASTTCAATLAAAGAFVAVTPYFIPLFHDYCARIGLEAVLQRSGQLGHVQFGWFDYLISLTPTCEQPWQGSSLLVDMGPLVFVIACAAVMTALTGRYGIGRLLLAIHCAVFLVAVTRPGHIKAIRFILPMLPALSVLVGWVIESGVERLARNRPRSWARAAVGAAALAAAGSWPAWHVVPSVACDRRPSTGALAREWISGHLPEHARVVAWPLFDSELLSLPYDFLTVENYGSRQYNVPVGTGVSPERQPIFAPDLIDGLPDDPPPYVIVNSYVGSQFAPTPENVRWFPISVDRYARMMERLERSSDRLYEIHGWSARRPGPDITIYRLRPARDR